MRRARVLMVGVYPIVQPQFGGPKRSRAVHDALISEVEALAYVAVYARQSGLKAGRDDITVGHATQDAIETRPHLADVLCGDAIYRDKRVRDRMTKLIHEFRPDVIVIEQVYPYLGLRALLDDLNVHPKLVYSSHNIEHRMKPSMYTFFGDAPEIAKAAGRRILQAEQALAEHSELVVAVSQDDLGALREMGARNAVLAPNGTSSLRASSRAIDEHQRYLAARGAHHTMAFVSSAHQPNWQGFLEMVGTRMGFLPPGVHILICGTVGDLIGPRVAPARVENGTFWQRTLNMGALSDDALAAAVLSADVLLLPITQGGGSNLKTAEALVSGRPIVATTFAFRGYEGYKSLPGVRIADTADEFRAAMLMALAEETVDRSTEQERLVRQLHWDARLAPLVEGIRAL